MQPLHVHLFVCLLDRLYICMYMYICAMWEGCVLWLCVCYYAFKVCLRGGSVYLCACMDMMKWLVSTTILWVVATLGACIALHYFLKEVLL